MMSPRESLVLFLSCKTVEHKSVCSFVSHPSLRTAQGLVVVGWVVVVCGGEAEGRRCVRVRVRVRVRVVVVLEMTLTHVSVHTRKIPKRAKLTTNLCTRLVA